MILVFLKGYILAAGDGSPRFVDIGFRPCEVVVSLGRALGNPLVNKLTRRIFDRSEVATRNVGLEPSFQFGCQCNWHHSLYYKDRHVGSGIQCRFAAIFALFHRRRNFLTDSRQSGPEFGPVPRSSGGAPGRVEEEVGVSRAGNSNEFR